MTTPTAAEKIRKHHAELAAELRGRAEALIDAVRAGADHVPARERLVDFLQGELIPHARAEEKALYPAAETGAGALLVRAMIDEHRNLLDRISALSDAAEGVDAVAGASAIQALFESHLAKENERILPLLEADPSVSLDRLLAGMHELLGSTVA